METSTTQDSIAINSTNASAWLVYDEEYRVLFCRYHGYALRDLGSHLRDYHAGPVAERRAVVQQYSRLVVNKPDDVKIPPPMQKPFTALQTPRRGFACDGQDCDFVTSSRDAIRIHCNKHHGWRARKKLETFWHQVWLQCFFPFGGMQRYFVVDYGEPGDHNGASSGGTDHDAMLRRWDAYREEHEVRADVVASETAKQDRTLWWKKTGWQEHLKGCNMRHLSSASRLPDQDEIELQQVRKSMQDLIEGCVKGLRTLDSELRRWLRSAKRSEPDLRPLARLETPASQQRYADYIARFVCYSLRVWCSLEQAPVATEQGFPSDSVAGDGSGSEDDVRGSSTILDPMADARRLFPWFGEQKYLAGLLWESLTGSAGEDEQKQRLHDFLQSVIYQTVRGDSFCSPMLHFLAILSIDGELGRLREANDFSYMLAGIVYCVRVLTVEHVLPSADRDAQSETDDARFLNLREKHLADGGFSPMSKMLSLLAYGKHIALNHQNAGSLFWDQDDAVVFRGRRIVIADFRSMLDIVISRAEDLLWAELMWTPTNQRFTIALEKLVDDVSYTKRGFSFLDDPVNRLQDTRRWMLKSMTAHPDGQKMRRDGQWRERRVRKYLCSVDRFREMLLFCIHLTGGQPARGTEVTAVRFRNGFIQDRNIFVINGQMVVVTRYHKSASQFDKPKVIPRFLPHRVGQLLAVYLAYVQDWATYLRLEMGGMGFSEHLWENEKGLWETDRLTKVIRQNTQEHLGTGLTTLEYRHVAIFIGRRVVGEGFAKGYREETGDVEEAEVDEDDPLEMSAGRGGEIGSNRYGVSTDVIKHLSNRTLEVFRPLSEGWHVFLGLSSSGGSKKRRSGRMEEEDNNGILARNGIDMSNWRRAMKRLRADTGLVTPPTSSPPTVQGGTRTFANDFGVSDGVEMDIRRVVSEHDVKAAMKKVLGQETVDFRSQHQRDSLLSVVNTDGQTPLVVVLPTGGGKSMLFMVPACLEDPGVTIVVVPFRALLDNLLTKAKGAGIDSVEWMSGATQRATLVFVSADRVGSTGFVGHMKQWEQRGVLRRVFLDEAHLAFKDNHWRAKLAGLRDIRQGRCPLIMLTATLPPVLESELERCMAAQYARYIRCPTTRARTRYMVETVKLGTLQERITQLCRRVQANLGRRRGVVFCKSRDQCESLAAELGVLHFMGQLSDNPERLQHWLEHNGLIVATSALGTGVDFERIVFTLHVDIPYSMIDFAQESGRGGRGGEDVDSLVVCEETVVERAYKTARNPDELAIAGFIRTQGCRRKVMSLHLDGREVTCGQGNHARCDGCGEGITSLERQYKREARERRLFEETMDSLVDFCAVCWVVAPADHDGWEHAAKDCVAGVHTVERVGEFRSRLRFNKDTHSCFKCGMSQRLCRTGQDSKEACQWPGRVAPILHALAEHGRRSHILKDCGYEGNGSDSGEYIRWLGQRHPRRIWNEVMSNGMAVLIGAVIDFEYDTGARLSNRSNAPRRFEGEASESGSTADREGTYVTEEETIVASSPPVALSGHGSREETDGDGVLGLGDDNDRPDKGYEGLEDDESQAHDSLTEPPGLVGHELEKSCEREVEQLRSEIQGHSVEGSDARNGVEGGDVAAVFRGEMKAAQLERLLES